MYSPTEDLTENANKSLVYKGKRMCKSRGGERMKYTSINYGFLTVPN